MKEPIWVGVDDCLHFHSLLLARYGGIAGIRDEGLLTSALSNPLNRYHYEEADLFELAASYAHGIMKNHPFLDGNKRTGFFNVVFFLEKNVKIFNASEAEAAVMTIGLAAGDLQVDGYAAWLRDNTT